MYMYLYIYVYTYINIIYIHVDICTIVRMHSSSGLPKSRSVRPEGAPAARRPCSSLQTIIRIGYWGPFYFHYHKDPPN